MYLIVEDVPFYVVKPFLNIVLKEKIWLFENVYVTYHGNPQLLMDFLVNVYLVMTA